MILQLVILLASYSYKSQFSCNPQTEQHERTKNALFEDGSNYFACYRSYPLSLCTKHMITTSFDKHQVSCACSTIFNKFIVILVLDSGWSGLID